MRLVSLGVSSIKWATFSNILKQILQFATVLVLPFFLEPTDFGLMALANVVIMFNNVFRNLGFSSALIQKKNISVELFSSLFFLNIFFGLTLALILFYFAPQISGLLTNNLQEKTDLIPILKVLSLGLFISSPSLIQQAILEKKLNFDKIARYEVISAFLGALTGVSLAIAGYGVWSLVFQNLVNVTVTGIALWILCPLKPIFIFKLEEIQSVLKFSLNLTGFQIINYLYRNIDKIIIGKFLGATELGYYSLAYRIMLYPLQNVTNIISKVMFPFYSKIQNENQKLRKGFTVVTNSIALITFPVMFGIALVSDELVKMFWGQEWQPVAMLILLLSPVAAIQSITTTTGSIYQAKGRTDLMLKWGIVLGIIFVASYLFGLRWGVSGVAFFYLVANVLLFFPWFKIPISLIGLDFNELMFSLKGVVTSTVIMLLFGVTFKLSLRNFLDLKLLFLTTIFIGATTYFISTMLFNKNVVITIKEIMFQKK